MKRSFALVAVECTTCHEVIELQIPVDYELHIDQDGDDAIRAFIPPEENYTAPVWDHFFFAHGWRQS